VAGKDGFYYVPLTLISEDAEWRFALSADRAGQLDRELGEAQRQVRARLMQLGITLS
jgi:hypothetical protein